MHGINVQFDTEHINWINQSVSQSAYSLDLTNFINNFQTYYLTTLQVKMEQEDGKCHTNPPLS